MCVALFACLATPLPQSKEAGKIFETSDVLQPQARILKKSEGIISTVLDIIPKISHFSGLGGNQTSNNLNRGQGNIVGLLRSVRPVLRASANFRGFKVNRDHIASLDAAEAITPSIFTFLDKLRSLNATLE
ncbi:hypothetical protein Hamer_G005313 [Homarus americanus]|uniref:Uncharacterized protein n=2 Tax=Homarus americanus TaxID=6706 RepID=A0A8J5JZR9_HOMAM|nr:hypothetical protein Hamer_G005313 [Homarus americanus]